MSTCTQLLVGMGELRATGEEASLNVKGIGSGVVVVAYDPTSKKAGCAHMILPEAPPDFDRTRPGKYTPIGITELIRMLQELGAAPDAIRVAMIGGAGTLGEEGSRHWVGALGPRNIEAAQRALMDLGVPCVAQDVGGRMGRSAVLETDTGTVRVGTPFKPEQVLCKLGGE